MRTHAIAALGLLVLGGCYSNDQFKRQLVPQAEYDLKCPKDHLTFTSLQKSEQTGFVTSYGVNGCGGEAVYVMDTHGGWILNDRRVQETRSGLVGAPPQPPPTAAGGCMKDTDCKGDRICNKGECVSPK